MDRDNRPSIIIPHHLDRWRHPIASKMRELARRIPEVVFYSFSSPQTEEDRELGKEIWSLNNIYPCSKSVLLQRSFDAVHHASATPTNIAATLLSKFRGVGRTTHMFTASVEPHEHDPYFREFTWAIRNCDRLIAGSDIVADAIYDRFGQAADIIITNGVDHELFDPQAAGTEILAEVGQESYVLFVSALLPRKRADILLRIATQMPEIKFVIAGRPSLRTGGRAIIQRINREPNIIYLGLRPKQTIRDLMAHASVFVFPSDLEGFSNVLLEATVMGLPILARPVSSIPEIIKEGLNGWLLEEEPIEAWINRIRVITNWSKEKRRSFRQEAREWGSVNFSWDPIAAKLRDFYIANLG